MDQIIAVLFSLFILASIYINVYAPYFKVTKSSNLNIMRAYVDMELNKKYRPRARAFLKGDYEI